MGELACAGRAAHRGRRLVEVLLPVGGGGQRADSLPTLLEALGDGLRVGDLLRLRRLLLRLCETQTDIHAEDISRGEKPLDRGRNRLTVGDVLETSVSNHILTLRCGGGRRRRRVIPWSAGAEGRVVGVVAVVRDDGRRRDLERYYKRFIGCSKGRKKISCIRVHATHRRLTL